MVHIQATAFDDIIEGCVKKIHALFVDMSINIDNRAPTAIRMFAGKGGVGKTTCAAAAALHYAASGKNTLAISTDGAPSLSHIFEVSNHHKAVRVQDDLLVSELGKNEIEEMWDRKFGPEVHEVFSSFVAVDYARFREFMTSLLPGLAEEFMVDYIREMARAGSYDTIVWDTAPLGQTMALLQTPAMLAQHLKMAPRIYSRLKIGRNSRQPVIEILRRWERLSAENMEFLKSVDFSLVAIPEALSVEQLDGIFRELTGFGFKVSQLIVNNVIKTRDSPFLVSKAEQQQKYLEIIRCKYAHLKIIELPLFPYEMKGLERLKEAERILFAES